MGNEDVFLQRFPLLPLLKRAGKKLLQRNAPHLGEPVNSPGSGPGGSMASGLPASDQASSRASSPALPKSELTPEQSLALDQAQAAFSYYMYKHRGWISRRVDRWSYSGGSQWRCDISFDLNMLTFESYYRDYYLALLPSDVIADVDFDHLGDWLLDGVAGGIMSDVDEDGDVGGMAGLPFNFPLAEISKELQFASFDLRDRNNHPLHLMTRSQAAMICHCMLVGAMAAEHADNPVEGVDPLDCRPENDHLAYTLHQWFEHTSFPADADGEISPDDYDFHERIVEAFCGVVDALADDNGEGGKWEDAENVKNRFRAYYEHSDIFRFFVDEFAYKWILFARVGLLDDTEIIKCSYTVPRDIARDLTGSDGPVVRFELGNVGMAEHSRTIVEAPKGMRFVPTPAIEGVRKVGKATRAAFGNPAGKWFFICDDVRAGMRVKPPFGSCRNDAESQTTAKPQEPAAESDGEQSAENAPHIMARGTLTAEHATLETIDPWSDDRKKRLRRLPVEGGVLHRYELWLSMRPQIGPRTIAQIVLAAVSLALFLMCLADPSVYLDADNFSFNTIIIVVTASFALVAVWDTPSYLRKRTTRTPLIATCLFVALDIAAFAFYFLFRRFAYSSSCCASCVNTTVPTIFTVLFALSALCLLIWELHWMYHNWWLPKKWDEGKKPHRVFDVDVNFVKREIP